MEIEKVLIVEDEEHERSGLAELISAWGYRTETARDGVEGLEKILSWSPGIVVTDLKMPRMDGIGCWNASRSRPRELSFILLTAQGSIDAAVVGHEAGRLRLHRKAGQPRPACAISCRTPPASAAPIANSKPPAACCATAESSARWSAPRRKMQEIFHLIELVAPSTASVLITGESGTGKELVARTIHELSPRKNKPFVAINCAAIPETLIESEIFGHEKGAFTGALERRTGCFELAESGTLLLDEIGEMPVGTQAKLLRVLEDRKLRRLGSKSETTVDVRVLAATNKVPEEAVARGQLRNDLYYRLNVFNIHMPPLRDHKEDIPDLTQTLIKDMNAKHQRNVRTVSDAVHAPVR